MKIILLKNVPKLGRQWEVKEVADGYARNILLPQKLAVTATKTTMDQAKNARKKDEQKAERSLKQTQELASALDEYELVLSARTNEQGDLYAAINAKQITDALGREGHSVNVKSIRIEDPIKRTGEHQVTIALDHGLEAQIKLIIEKLSESEL